MNSAQNLTLIDEMLLKLETGQKSMNKQIVSISDIGEKSNNILLQIEATHSLKILPTTPNLDVYSFSKETLHSLAQIMQLYQRIVAKDKLVNNENGNRPRQVSVADFETFLLSNRQKMEILGGSVRKLLAINDTVTQMKANLQIQAEEFDEDIFSE